MQISQLLGGVSLSYMVIILTAVELCIAPSIYLLSSLARIAWLSYRVGCIFSQNVSAGGSIHQICAQDGMEVPIVV